MRHRKDISKLRRPAAHRQALVHSLVRSLVVNERITTTLAKAKVAQRLAERIVSRSQRNDLSARRYAYSYLGSHSLVKRLFDEVRPRFEDRKSGFTKIFRLGTRQGDGAEMAILEMTVKSEKKVEKKKTQSQEKAKAKTKPKAQPKAGKGKTKQEEKPKKAQAKKPDEKRPKEKKEDSSKSESE